MTGVRQVPCPPYKVSENLYRGPFPDEQILETLASLGVTRLVTLCDESYEAAWIKEECVRLGFENIHIPLSPYCGPDDSEVGNFLRLLEQCRENPTYVHCIHGRDRTGTMLAIYRLRSGWTYEEAIEEMRHYGFFFGFSALLARVRAYSQT
jgi:protein-tyrosine phosphatase